MWIWVRGQAAKVTCQFFFNFLIYLLIILRSSIQLGTLNIPEHPGTLNNYDNYEKTCKIKFSKTEKTSNLEAAMLKLHKCYRFMMLL